jgi:hypothetical protein
MQADGTAAPRADARSATTAFAARGASTSGNDAARGCTPIVSNASGIAGPRFLITS